MFERLQGYTQENHIVDFCTLNGKLFGISLKHVCAMFFDIFDRLKFEIPLEFTLFVNLFVNIMIDLALTMKILQMYFQRI